VPSVTPVAGLAVNLEATPTSLLPGETLTLRITASNGGPSDATGVHVKLALPDGMSFLSGDNCAASAGTVDCAFGTLAAPLLGGVPPTPASRDVQVVPTLSGSHAVTATISAVEAGSGSVSTQVTRVVQVGSASVTPAADLSVTLAGTPNPVAAGANLALTATVKNSGPNTATGVSVSFTLPDQAQLSSIFDCSQQGSTVSCDIGSLASGKSTARTIVIKPMASGAADIVAQVSPEAGDTNSADNRDALSITVTPTASLSIALTPPDPVPSGGNLDLTAKATNAGPDSATGVHIKFALPSDMSFAAGTGCVLSSGLVDCPAGTLKANESTSRTVTFIPTQLGNTSITASVSANEASPNSPGLQDTQVVTVNPAADLAMALTGSPASVGTGSVLTLTARISNNGPSPASGVTASVNLPAGMGYSSSTGCVATGSAVNCAIGSVASGASVSRSILVVPNVEGTATITGAVSSPTSDPTPANNQASLTVPVTAVDLSLTLGATPSIVVSGSQLVLTATVTNSGTSTATGVFFDLSLPTGTSFVSGPGCSASGNTVTCSVGDLASGISSAPRSIVLIPKVAGTVSIVATVDADQSDSNAADNQASVGATVTGGPVNLAVSLSADQSQVQVGSDLNIKAVVTNQSFTTTATQVKLVFTFPSNNVQIVAASGCSVSGNTVSCELNNLAFFGGLAVRSVQVRPVSAGMVSIQAAASSLESDSNPADNQSAAAIAAVATATGANSASSSSSAAAPTSAIAAPASTSSMLVTAPNGGELWSVGEIAPIAWSLFDYPANKKVVVSLSRNAGKTWKPLKTVRNTGSFGWRVGKNFVTNQGRIKVCQAQSTNVCDQSDGTFVIAR